MTEIREGRILKNLGRHIMIMGSSGSGKSTMATRLGKLAGLSVIHLDKLTRGITSGELIIESAKKAAMGSEWIIDGNYSGSRDFRLARADTVIYLDFNRCICLFRLLKRSIKNSRHSQRDIVNGCPKNIDLQSIKRIWTYPQLSRDKTLNWLSNIKFPKQVFILKGNKEVRRFLRQVGDLSVKT